jgi:hypothetical protein
VAGGANPLPHVETHLAKADQSQLRHEIPFVRNDFAM